MPAFQVEVPHQLGRAQALERLKAFLPAIAEKYKGQISKIDGEWAENVLNLTLTTFGLSISGVMTVDEDAVRLKGQLPFAAIAFKGKIERDIASALKEQLT